MRTHRRTRLMAWPAWLWGFDMLILFALAACGVVEPGATMTTPAAPATAAASAQETPAAPTTAAPATAPPTQAAIATPAPPTGQPAPTAARPAPSPVRPEPLDPTVAVTITPAPPAPPATLAPAATGAWQTYRDEQAGYAVEYPAGWTASAQPRTDSSAVTSFAPAGGSGISVLVMPGGPNEEGADMPNTRCQDVTVGGLSGRRCVDTISFGISTTLAGQGKTYTIAASGKGVDQAVYQRFLESFRPIP